MFVLSRSIHESPESFETSTRQISDDGLKQLQDNEQIAFTYHQKNGGSPNGSVGNIAGVFNAQKNVLGMMPHPERAADEILASQDGLKIFKSILSVA